MLFLGTIGNYSSEKGRLVCPTQWHILDIWCFAVWAVGGMAGKRLHQQDEGRATLGGWQDAEVEHAPTLTSHMYMHIFPGSLADFELNLKGKGGEALGLMEPWLGSISQEALCAACGCPESFLLQGWVCFILQNHVRVWPHILNWLPNTNSIWNSHYSSDTST